MRRKTPISAAVAIYFPADQTNIYYKRGGALYWIEFMIYAAFVCMPADLERKVVLGADIFASFSSHSLLLYVPAWQYFGKHAPPFASIHTRWRTYTKRNKSTSHTHSRMKNGAHDTFIIAVRCCKSKYFMRRRLWRNARPLAPSHFKTSTLAQWDASELCKNCEWRDFSF